MLLNDTRYKSLGLMNMWKDTPKEVCECRDKKHIVTEVKVIGWSCYHIMYCDICNIKYACDSSG